MKPPCCFHENWAGLHAYSNEVQAAGGGLCWLVVFLFAIFLRFLSPFYTYFFSVSVKSVVAIGDPLGGAYFFLVTEADEKFPQLISFGLVCVYVLYCYRSVTSYRGRNNSNDGVIFCL